MINFIIILIYIYQWSPLLLLQFTIIIVITNSWPMVKKITSNINNALDSTLKVVHHAIDTTVNFTIDYLITNLPDSNPKDNQKQRHQINKPSRSGNRLKLGSLTILTHSMSTSTCSAMTSINTFPTPLSTQITPMQLDADSHILGIDNREARCISQHRGDFIGKL